MMIKMCLGQTIGHRSGRKDLLPSLPIQTPSPAPAWQQAATDTHKLSSGLQSSAVLCTERECVNVRKIQNQKACINQFINILKGY